MLNNIIKFSFATVGCITGITLTRTFFIYQLTDISPEIKILAYIVIALALGFIFYTTSNKLIEIVMESLDRLELFIQKLTLYEMMVGSVGLIIGLIIANLVTIPIKNIDIIGTPVSIVVNILFGCLGVAVAAGKKNENIFESFRGRASDGAGKGRSDPKILDTSVIIDGRIIDIC
ncbi:MAG TPA: PIN/TRAM domain-containing protein, partial [Clostridiales bacterium]|nr:PIN/TRAM domain-containing protein [Clostridiales bacterium]